MTSIIYTAILVVFIFGAGMTYINDTGLYATKMHSTGLTTSQEQANQTSTALSYEAQHPSAFSTWNQLGIAWRSIWGGIVALFTLNYILMDFGVSPGLAGFLVSPLAIIVVYWAIEFWLGRPVE